MNCRAPTCSNSSKIFGLFGTNKYWLILSNITVPHQKQQTPRISTHPARTSHLRGGAFGWQGPGCDHVCSWNSAPRPPCVPPWCSCRAWQQKEDDPGGFRGFFGTMKVMRIIPNAVESQKYLKPPIKIYLEPMSGDLWSPMPKKDRFFGQRRFY